MPAVSHLRALQALELAIRKGSLRAAADELAITPAAVGQRIRALENYLGADLLVRGRSGTRPAPALDAALAHLGAAFRELETASRLLDFQRVQEIHISADSDWVDLWLTPRLDTFRRDNPNTRFCINGVGDVPVRLGDADCNVHFTAGDDGELLFRDYLVPVTSPTNERRVAALPAASRLEGFPLLHLDCYTADGGGIGWPEWSTQHGYRRTAPDLGIRYRRVVHALEAVFADSGFMICGIALVRNLLDAGRLTTPFAAAMGALSTNAYRVTFRERPHREALARFRDWLLAEAGVTRDDLQVFIAGEG